MREWGGVLEHPAHSQLWKLCGLPKPGEEPDVAGGMTYYVEQVDWGHCCVKPTWLYIVGRTDSIIREQLAARAGQGVATHCVCTGPRQLRRLPVASKKMKMLTPEPFARLLVDIARNVMRR